jgi:diguanylate cyclase (GGDEF)-like protein
LVWVAIAKEQVKPMSLMNHQAFDLEQSLPSGTQADVAAGLWETSATTPDIQLHCLSLLEAVASTANRSADPITLLEMVVKLICIHAGFPAGNALIREGVAGEIELHGCGAAYVRTPQGAEAFASICNRFSTWACAIAPGRLLLDPEPVCQLEIGMLPNFSRNREARDAGLQTLVALPVMVSGEVEAVLEFFSDAPEPIAPQLIELLAHASREISFVFQRAQNEQALRRDALHDQLTGLPNRSMFESALKQSFDSAHQAGRSGPTLIFVDIDGLKLVNDMYGHQAGDGLIEAIAARVQRVVAEFGAAERLLLHYAHRVLLARLAGDEFTIMIEGPDQQNLACEITDELHRCLKVPHFYGQIPIRVTASIGVASDDGHYGHAHELLRDADAAMYRAKLDGRGKTVVFDTQMRMASLDSLRIEAELRHAIDRHKFELHYQPICRLETGAIVGVEALIRWRKSSDELVAPDNFIHIAEEKGLISEIGEQALRQACGALLQFEGMGLGDATPFVSVNVSAGQFLEADFPDRIEAAIYETGITPSLLALEVTETAAINDLQLTIAVLKRLRGLGLRVGLDDFGTGFSSLSHLQSLPFDGIKIDRSFVMSQADVDSNWSIVSAILQMAKAFGTRVTAEGIETRFQLEKLKKLGCEYGQGYLLGHPCEISRISSMVRNRECLI